MLDSRAGDRRMHLPCKSIWRGMPEKWSLRLQLRTRPKDVALAPTQGGALPPSGLAGSPGADRPRSRGWRSEVPFVASHGGGQTLNVLHRCTRSA